MNVVEFVILLACFINQLPAQSPPKPTEPVWSAPEAWDRHEYPEPQTNARNGRCNELSQPSWLCDPNRMLNDTLYASISSTLQFKCDAYKYSDSSACNGSLYFGVAIVKKLMVLEEAVYGKAAQYSDVILRNWLRINSLCQGVLLFVSWNDNKVVFNDSGVVPQHCKDKLNGTVDYEKIKEAIECYRDDFACTGIDPSVPHPTGKTVTIVIVVILLIAIIAIVVVVVFLMKRHLARERKEQSASPGANVPLRS